ncbi:hypothetical protein AAHE18_16G091100 [Arachis hypogaea]
MRCWVLPRNLRILIFLSVSDNSVDLHFSTSSFRLLYESWAARETRVDSSRVDSSTVCPNSAAMSVSQYSEIRVLTPQISPILFQLERARKQEAGMSVGSRIGLSLSLFLSYRDSRRAAFFTTRVFCGVA